MLAVEFLGVDPPPRRIARLRPRTARAADRIVLLLARFAADTFEADIHRTARGLHEQRVPDDAVISYGHRRRVDNELMAGRGRLE